MFIDSTAATPITSYSGDVSNLEHLKYDIVNAAHYLRRKSDVLVVGVGGGRDVLSALVFNQKSVVAVEINGDILKAINQRYGDFTGHLDRDVRVHFVNDEARSYVTRQSEHFDIIQVALVDTWAASSAGAFVLTENSLYTTEAWKTFISKLTDRGILTFSRWYIPESPWEMYRLTSLATEALHESGVQNARRNIIILRWMGAGIGVGTILVSKQPFSDADITQMRDYAKRMGFEEVLTPSFTFDNVFGQIASSEDTQKFTSSFAADITPPTDDRPFFFNMLRLRDFLHPERLQRLTQTNINVITILIGLAVFVTVLTIACILVPLGLTANRTALRGCTPLLAYFGCIGIGFMLVEVSQMQRLIVFLGHPTYALSVVLFSLLTFSGLGSLLASKIVARGQAVRSLGALLLSLIVFGGATPAVVAHLNSAQTPIRILAAILILAPIGFLMGNAFPLGMKAASYRSAAITPWLWGINGATSVCASVFAVIISLENGISAAFWMGVGAYLIATAAFVSYQSRQEERLEELAPQVSAEYATT
jgi:spermidine synthase